MVTSETWVMLSYRIPREPSTPRIAVWRRLKSLGVVQIGDGLVALPYDSSTKEALEWVANSVLEAEGEATIWIATPTIRRWGTEAARRMDRERATEFQALTDKAEALEQDGERSKRTIQALRRELRRIQRRDYFSSAEGRVAVEVINRLVAVGESQLNQ